VGRGGVRGRGIGLAANWHAPLWLWATDAHLRFLLTGDIEQRTEAEIFENHVPLAADFLKGAHQGSKTSSTEDWIAPVAPRLAAVSVREENPFGHPFETAAERFDRHGVGLPCTDRDGTITALTDGTNLSVHTAVER